VSVCDSHDALKGLRLNRGLHTQEFGVMGEQRRTIFEKAVGNQHFLEVQTPSRSPTPSSS